MRAWDGSYDLEATEPDLGDGCPSCGRPHDPWVDCDGRPMLSTGQAPCAFCGFETGRRCEPCGRAVCADCGRGHEEQDHEITADTKNRAPLPGGRTCYCRCSICRASGGHCLDERSGCCVPPLRARG